MLPEEVYIGASKSSKLRYTHPLNQTPIDDGSMRARLAYDLMNFMGNNDCNYFMNPDAAIGYNPTQSDDEVDIMIVDGFYKEAEILVDHRLEEEPNNEKYQFQKAFIQHLHQEYERLLAREEKTLRDDPRNVNALINKGFALANLNREEEALTIIDQASRIDPENITILSNKAYIAKLLGKDELREKTIMQAYNTSAKHRIAELEEQEARLLEDMDSLFIAADIPSAFEEFNISSGFEQSHMVH